MLTTGNVCEVLPGITRPLPADLITEWDYQFTTGMAEQLAVLDLVPTAKPPAMNVLGFVGGRWTLNIAWSLAITATYQVGGGSEMLAQFVEGENLTSGQAADQTRAAATRRKIMRRWRNAEQEIARQRVKSLRARDSSLKRAYARLPNQELLDLVEANSSLCADLFITHVIVSVGGAEFTGLLGGLIDSNIKRHPATWITTLTSALTDVESAEPGKAIWDMSRLVAKRAPLALQMRKLAPELIAARLAAPPDAEWKKFAAAYRAFIHEFGFRGQREVDPSTRSWDEAQNFVIGAIRADLDSPASRNPHALERRTSAARRRLETRLESRLPEKARKQYHEYLQLAQSLDRLRESTKANWARSCRNYRPPVMELGRRLAASGVIAEPDDVWYLRLAELREAADGKLAATAARKAITERKGEYERLQDFQLPDVFQLPVELIPIERAKASKDKVFQGVAISGGTATGKARVILSADAAEDAHIEPGEVLVAPVTDAPWSPLFVPAAAVVVEVGGMLSHAAIVAREYGIPAVAGIKGATQLIKTGMTVTVDGNKGTVTIE
jgi:pyruvate,water dikinase